MNVHSEMQGNAASMREGEKISAETRQRSVDDSGCPNVLKNITDIIAQSTPVGNAAAMRKALTQCELFLGNVSRHGHPTLCLGDQCTACNGVDELRGMVVRALSTPPRNCDRFATGEDALKAWQAYQRKHMEFDERWRTWDCIGWLLAPVAEQKGDGDAI